MCRLFTQETFFPAFLLFVVCACIYTCVRACLHRCGGRGGLSVSLAIASLHYFFEIGFFNDPEAVWVC